MSRLMATMDTEMTQGLSDDPEERRQTSLQMAPSYIRSLLDGTGSDVTSYSSTCFRVYVTYGVGSVLR